MAAKINKIHGREVLDSRGFPTVEAEVYLDNGVMGRAIVPSGASTGAHEALELRDGDKKRYHGKGTLKAVEFVNGVLANAVKGLDPQDLAKVDGALIAADGTPNKTKLGANSILAVSLASAKAAALDSKISLAEWIHKKCLEMGYACQMKTPVPLMNVINGGAHADNGLDVQEFMLVPHGFTKFSEALRAGSEIFHVLKKQLAAQGLTTAVGDEGGFAPKLPSNLAALELLVKAISEAGYKVGEQVSLALDVAATEFYADGFYQFKDASLGKCNSQKVIEYYASLAAKYPLVSIEDGLAEDDWQGWADLSKSLGSKLQLVGDDLFVTQEARLARGIEHKISNAILIKLNQVGSLWETLKTMKLAASAGYASISSHRSGESEDTTLAHLAVGTGCGQVKTGSLSRSDRIAKYNEILRLEEQLKCPMATFRKFK